MNSELITKYSFSTSNYWKFFPVLILSVSFYISLLIPPLQSPDEPSHLFRAYLLSKGEIILDHKNGVPGGSINQGFLDYIYIYGSLIGDQSRKISQIEIRRAAKIKWSETQNFIGVSSAIYFPLVYTPQALAFFIGEKTNLSVHYTYLLARVFALLFSMSILYYSFFLFRPSAFIIALLIIPMSIFQFGSASLDGISTSISILSISCFLKLVNNKSDFKLSVFIIMMISMGIIATSRIHLFPILILPFVIFFNNKKKSLLIISIITTLLVILWYNVVSNNYSNPNSDITKQSATFFYLSHPLTLFKIIFINQPLSDFSGAYHKSFIGILGWLDTWFDKSDYNIISGFLIIIFLVSISIRSIAKNFKISLLLLFVSLSSIFALMFIFLISNSEFPTELIQGIQGRYFLIPLLIIGYSINSSSVEMPIKRHNISLFLIFCLLIYSTTMTSNLLIRRYYTNTYITDNSIKLVKPGKRLTNENPIKLIFSDLYLKNPTSLKSISILFGTYRKVNPGTAELVLYTADKDSTVTTFDLSGLIDNTYQKFELDNKIYVSGRIVSGSGEGISSYEVQETSSITTCIIFELGDGRKIYTNGSPF